MLVVKLELHPGGDASRAREIGRMEIANVSELAPVSDYRVAVTKRWMVGNEETSETGYFEICSHRRSDGAWTLVRRAFEQCEAWSRRHG